MNRQKAQFFDEQVNAQWAAEEYGGDEAPKLERLKAAAGIEPGMSVLEPGCGTGRLTAHLAHWTGATGKVVAMDISQAMAEACARRISGLPHAEAHNLAMEDLDAEPGSFQRIICHQVFPHFDNQTAALAMMADLLAPGGRLVIVHFIDWATINDTHRKAGTVVEKDLMPDFPEMSRMLDEAGLSVTMFADDELGYLLRASKQV